MSGILAFLNNNLTEQKIKDYIKAVFVEIRDKGKRLRKRGRAQPSPAAGATRSPTWSRA